MYPLKQARGGALLTALFIMTLVAIVATAMSMRLQLDIYRTRLIVTHDRLYLASQGITFWALNLLNDKQVKFTKLDKQGMVAQYPKDLMPIDKQIKLSGGLYDLQARFNLNNLVEKKLILPFINLVKNTDSQLNDKERINLALAIQDWLTNYDLDKGEDKFTSYYLSQKPAYYPSHQLLASTTELRLIKDVTAPLYQTLEPLVTSLPETTPININTASSKVLMSLGNGMTNAQAKELIMARGENGIKDLKDISELAKKIDLPNAQITIESQYFLNVAIATTDDFKIVVYSLFKRSKDNKGTLSVSLIRESINSF